jgi:hypothetical protein
MGGCVLPPATLSSETYDFIDHPDALVRKAPGELVNLAMAVLNEPFIFPGLTAWDAAAYRIHTWGNPEVVTRYTHQGFPGAYSDILAYGPDGTYYCPDIFGGALVYASYQAGLGRTEFYLKDPEHTERERLLGAVKGGDTLGVITPDSVLLAGELAVKQPIGWQVTASPNPSRGKVVVQWQATNPGMVSLLCMDGTQAMVPVRAVGRCELDVEPLPAGIYLLRLEQSGGLATQLLSVMD